MPRPLLSVLITLFLALPWVGFAQQPGQLEDPFRVEIAPIDVPAGGSAGLGILLVIPEGHHLYRDMLEVRLDEPGAFTVGELDVPLGELEPDPAFPERKREAYHETFTMTLPLHAPGDLSGEYELEFQVRYQGCKDKICFLPGSEGCRSTSPSSRDRAPRRPTPRRPARTSRRSGRGPISTSSPRWP